MRKLWLIVLVLILAFPLALAAEENATDPQLILANDTLSNMEESITKLESLTLPTAKMNDLLFEAEQNFEVQTILQESGGTTNYERVFEIGDEILTLESQIYATYDELTALGTFIDTEKATLNVNFVSVDTSFSRAEQEFSDERFDRASDSISETYLLLSELRATENKAKAAYQATAETVEQFIKRIWKKTLIVVAILLVLGAIFRKAIDKFILKKRLKHLEKEKEILHIIIKETQEAFFDKRTLNESEYRVRMKKFSELIRDINTKIPALKERLERDKK